MLKNYIAAIVAGILVMAAQFSFSQGADRASKKEAAVIVNKVVANCRHAGEKPLSDFPALGKAYGSK